MAKFTAKTDTQQDVTEPLESQYAILANKIQNLQHRQCLIRYFRNERDRDPLIHAVGKTTDAIGVDAGIWELTERLLKEHCVSVRDALKEINERKLGPSQNRSNNPPLA